MKKKLVRGLVLAIAAITIIGTSVTAFADSAETKNSAAVESGCLENGNCERAGNRGKNFVDENNDGICDNKGQNENGKGKNFVDADNDGVCDNFIDNDGDGICDNKNNKENGKGQNFVDNDGDGICDSQGNGCHNADGNGKGLQKGKNRK